MGPQSFALGLYGFTDVNADIGIGGPEEIDLVYRMRRQSLFQHLGEKIPISSSRIDGVKYGQTGCPVVGVERSVQTKTLAHLQSGLGDLNGDQSDAATGSCNQHEIPFLHPAVFD